MARLVAILVLLGLVASVTPAQAQAHDMQACGVLRAYIAPSAQAPGRLSLGTSTFEIAPGTTQSSVNISVGVGERGCMIATSSAAGALTSLGFSPFPPSFCGEVARIRPASASSPGELLLGQTASLRMIIPVGTVLNVRAGESSCFVTGLTSGGDLVAAGVAPDARGSAGDAPKQLPSAATAGTRVASAALIVVLAGLSILLAARRLRVARADD